MLTIPHPTLPFPLTYRDLTDGVSVVATAEVPPAAPTADPGQTVPVAGPTGLVVPPVGPGDRRAIQPHPAPLSSGVSGSQPERDVAHLTVEKSHPLLRVHLSQVASYGGAVSLSLAPGLRSDPQAPTFS